MKTTTWKARLDQLEFRLGAKIDGLRPTIALTAGEQASPVGGIPASTEQLPSDTNRYDGVEGEKRRIIKHRGYILVDTDMKIIALCGDEQKTPWEEAQLVDRKWLALISKVTGVNEPALRGSGEGNVQTSRAT